MQIYKNGESQIEIGGVAYAADENGVIAIPDDKVTSTVWSKGFVLAAGHLAEIEQLQAAQVVKAPAVAVKVDELEEKASPQPADNKAKKS